MENATKALLIAAGVLIGIMILSVGITLYNSLGSFVEKYQKEADEIALHKFNEQFTRYINCDEDDELQFTLTIQDIVTAANNARENNQKYQLEEPTEYNYYVTVNMTGNANLEKTINSISAEILRNNIDKKYKCTINNVKINGNTGRVCEISFSEILEI